MNPRAEAFERLGARYEVRVLEPSPPAVNDPPWFADDPAARGRVPAGRKLVSPVGNGELSWEEVAAGDTALGEWCGERWLGPWPRLGGAPPGLPATRASLHALAEFVISPARRRANGKIGLRFTRGGFGTPFFGDDVQIRVIGLELIVVRGGSERAAPITTLVAAAQHVGLVPDGSGPDDQPLAVEPSASAFLGEWYGFAASVLEELRYRADPQLIDASRVQLWPEHFDLAVELGSEAAGTRAAYGCSPGDGNHAEPYLYVAPWAAPDPDDLWQATGFTGAELGYGELAAASDQRETALRFFWRRRAALTGKA